MYINFNIYKLGKCEIIFNYQLFVAYIAETMAPWGLEPRFYNTASILSTTLHYRNYYFGFLMTII